MTKANWKRRILLFLISQCITLFGSQLVQMAIVWYATLQTNSGGWVAAFSVCAYLPQFFVSFLGGVWADRYNRKRLIIIADGTTAAVTLMMMAVMPRLTSEPVMLTALLIMSFIRSAAAGVQTPAVNAVIPQLVPPENLARWNGVNATLQSLVQFLAPATAAVVLTTSTLRATLAIDVVTAMMGIGLLAIISLPRAKRQTTTEKAAVGAGFRYAFSQRIIRNALVTYGLFLFMTVPAGYLAGLFVSRTFGDTYWYLTAVEVVGFGGMLLGGVLMSLWNGFRRHQSTLAIGLALFGLMAVCMGCSGHFSLYLVCMAVYGVALTCVQTTLTTLLQQYAREDMQGRIFGLMSALYAACYPLGMAVFGPLADHVPLQGLMILSGAALMLMAGMVFKKEWI